MRLGRLFLFFVLNICYLVSHSTHAQTLEALAEITAGYKSFKDFVADKEAVTRYREALKAYMGDDRSYDAVFDRSLSLVQDACKKIPGFCEKAWRKNPNWKEGIFSIQGQFSGSGLEVPKVAVQKALADLKNEATQGAHELLEKSPDKRKEHVEELIQAAQEKLKAQEQAIEEAKKEAGILSKENFNRLSRAQKAEYNKSVGERLNQLQHLKNNLKKGLKDDPLFKTLGAYAAAELLEHDESLQDSLHSNDADIIQNELKNLQQPKNFKEALAARGINLPESVLAELHFESPTIETYLNAFEEGIQSAQELKNIADPRLSPELLARLHALQAQQVPENQILQKLGAKFQKEYRVWYQETQEVRQQKEAHASTFKRNSPFFYYDLVEDPARGTLRLKSQSGTELFFKPAPDNFLSFFLGRKTGECVGGRDCESLTLRRIARGILDGSETLLTETGDGRMEGFVGLTALKHKKTNDVWSVVDLGSRAIKGDVVVKGEDGRKVKFSFFDLFVDHMKEVRGSKGLVISDGNSVSQNIGGAEAVLQAPSYVANHIVGQPEDFEPADPMAHEIVKKYPGGLYPDKMIQDGMKENDVTKVVHLLPSSRREKWTKEEVEARIIARFVIGANHIDDRDVVWKMAQESGVRIQSMDHYRDLARQPMKLAPKTVKHLIPGLEEGIHTPRYPHYDDADRSRILRISLLLREIAKTEALPRSTLQALVEVLDARLPSGSNQVHQVISDVFVQVAKGKKQQAQELLKTLQPNLVKNELIKSFSDWSGEEVAKILARIAMTDSSQAKKAFAMLQETLLNTDPPTPEELETIQFRESLGEHIVDGKTAARKSAAEGLTEMIKENGPQAKKAIAALEQVLTRTEDSPVTSQIRSSIIYKLGDLIKAKKPIPSPLIKALRAFIARSPDLDELRGAHKKAADLLMQSYQLSAAPSHKSVSDLEKILQKSGNSYKDFNERTQATRSLVDVIKSGDEDKAEEALEALRRTLNHPKSTAAAEHSRRLAVEALGPLGSIGDKELEQKILKILNEFAANPLHSKRHEAVASHMIEFGPDFLKKCPLLFGSLMK